MEASVGWMYWRGWFCEHQSWPSGVVRGDIQHVVIVCQMRRAEWTGLTVGLYRQAPGAAASANMFAAVGQG